MTPTRARRRRWRSCSKGPRGSCSPFVTPMVWHAEDWKYLFPAGGTPAMEVIPDLTGYVPWSAF